ncbi:uncharacterized protein A4U43_C04F16610 [Asparagus officinalis]|uniref:Exoribonuclease phosphorolytic domain-containing protein n=1 Tax=Asparagus officinalis TaxID=4686 RepID=A0A5P1F6R2_ASPOF|nr:uncharacterized protein A4U43_C04F16610 [Asparagus officinalis]
MEVDRLDGRNPNQLRPLACSRNVLHRAHGSARWSQGDTIVLAAVYGPKAGTRKGENPEKCEMILKRTLQSICLLSIHPNTTTSVIVQVVGDDGALLPCAINASCAALVDAGIPLKHLAVAISCALAENGSVILDPTLVEEQKMLAIAHLAFPNPPLSVIPKSSASDEVQPIEHGIITSVTHGAMSVRDYFNCLERGRAASAKVSEFLRRSFQLQVSEDSSKAI